MKKQQRSVKPWTDKQKLNFIARIYDAIMNLSLTKEHIERFKIMLLFEKNELPDDECAALVRALMCTQMGLIAGCDNLGPPFILPDVVYEILHDGVGLDKPVFGKYSLFWKLAGTLKDGEFVRRFWH